MKKNSIMEMLKKASPQQKVIAVVLTLLILMSGALLLRGFMMQTEQSEITRDQIKIQKGDDIVIINKNGLIEYRSKDKILYKTWDSARISAFFDSMQRKARNYLDNQQTDSPGCYLVTLWLDDELVTVCISIDDEEIGEIFEEFEEEDGDDDPISDYFDDDGDDDVFSSPTPTTYLSATATPTPTDEEEYSPDDNYPPVEADCLTWSQDIVDKAIISNTLCTIEQ